MPVLPVISFAVIFINSQVGILLFLMSCLFNIILSATLKRTYEDDLKSIFYASNVLKQGYTISQKLNMLHNLKSILSNLEQHVI